MSEEDLLSAGGAREPLRTCCFKLAGRLWAVCQRAGAYKDSTKHLQASLRYFDAAEVACSWRQPSASTMTHPPLHPHSHTHLHTQAAVTGLRSAANTEAAAGEGRLDASLVRLARALDPGFPSTGSRLEAAELATAVLQVGWARQPVGRSVGSSRGSAGGVGWLAGWLAALQIRLLCQHSTPAQMRSPSERSSCHSTTHSPPLSHKVPCTMYNIMRCCPASRPQAWGLLCRMQRPPAWRWPRQKGYRR